MTLLFMDGFDHYDTAGQLLDKWDSGAIGGVGTLYGRFGSEGVYFSSLSTNLNKLFPGTYTTLYMGVAYYYAESNPSYNSGYPLIRFYDDSSVIQVQIHPTSSYAFAAYRGDNTLLGTSSNNVFNSNRWHYLEVKVTISDTTGEVVMRVDGSTILNLTSQDTKNGSAYIGSIRLHPTYADWDTYYDDFYVDDAQFHGDCRVRTFVPDSDGNSSDFTRSTGSNDYECVDEQGSNEDTDYIYSDTLNHKSIFGITTGSLGTVEGVQVNNHVRLDQAGTRKIKAICRSNSVDYQGSESDAIPANYIYESEIWETDPDDSGAWTQTKLEAAEFGLEITT